MWCVAISLWLLSASTPCRSANIFSNPPNVTPNSNTPGSVPTFWNVCGVLLGMKTKEPAGALMTRSPRLEVELTTQDITELGLHSVQVRGRSPAEPSVSPCGGS
jgi:hypothetical protein